MPRPRRIGRVAPAPERSEGRASYGDAGACCSRSCDGDGRVAGDAERCAGDVFGAIAGPVVDARRAAVHAGRRGERRAIRTDSKRRISYDEKPSANFQPRVFRHTPMPLRGNPGPQGGFPPGSRAEGRAGSHTGADAPAGGDPGPLGRPRPPRARLWACIHPPPCRRDGHRGRGPGST